MLALFPIGEKAKPAVRWGRKAAGLLVSGRQPGYLSGQTGFLFPLKEAIM